MSSRALEREVRGELAGDRTGKVYAAVVKFNIFKRSKRVYRSEPGVCDRTELHLICSGQREVRHVAGSEPRAQAQKRSGTIFVLETSITLLSVDHAEQNVEWLCAKPSRQPL